MVDELRNRAELRRFANIVHIPSADTVYRFISSINEDQFVGLINALLRTECMNPRWHKNRTYLIDSTAITLDLNIFKKRYTRSDLVEKDYAWGYSTTNGYYLGYKLTLVVEYPTLIPVAFFMHRGSPGDARLLAEVLTLDKIADSLSGPGCGNPASTPCRRQLCRPGGCYIPERTLSHRGLHRADRRRCRLRPPRIRAI